MAGAGAGYVIVDVRVHDAEAYKAYTSQVPATMEPFGGRFIVRGGEVRVLEGDWTPQRAVLIEFPSVERAQAWYDSDAYQAILPIRLANSTAKFFAIVDGV